MEQFDRNFKVRQIMGDDASKYSQQVAAGAAGAGAGTTSLKRNHSKQKLVR
jgi:hypothetical protein